MKLSIALVLPLALVHATEQSDGIVRHRQVRRNDGDKPTKIKSLDRTVVDEGDKKEKHKKNNEVTQKESKKEKDTSNVVETETNSKDKDSKKVKESKKERSPADESATASQKDQKKEKMDTKTIQLEPASIDVADIVRSGNKEKDKKREDKKNSEEPEEVATVDQVEETASAPATAAPIGSGGRGAHRGKKHVGRGNGRGGGHKLNGGTNFSTGKSDKEMDELASFRKKTRNGNRLKTKNRGAGKIRVNGADAADNKKKTTSVNKTRASRGHRIGGRAAAFDSKSGKS
ncbi:hypothetical protein HJC23_001071 [Cyclotella cryptica]|uniref:Uncharacterized protein n=1 Tax=Cyclotella cryptica TaxID=29204 RepID=A0ABD3QI76_9STRA|eukprot:CCRYP_005034-RA/>CCRYP_005034-RA protein AED:0.20 eAED:0.20 QI:0/-1/0/1/-1/1/1/0/287